jgi:hypothetical protein
MTLSTEFSAAVADGVRVLSLGKALSPAHPGLLAQRSENGFDIGELRAGPANIAERPGVTEDLLETVFRARQEAGAVVLLRAPRLAAWGLSGRALPVRYFQMFGYTKAQEIPVAKPNPRDIETVLSGHPDTPALLLSDGRVLIWAPNPARAIRLVLSLEEAAYVTALADHLGGAQDYPATAREKIYSSLQSQARQ